MYIQCKCAAVLNTAWKYRQTSPTRSKYGTNQQSNQLLSIFKDKSLNRWISLKHYVYRDEHTPSKMTN
uniref:Uncharacterized protein n=1 Tax=Arion vulgaris TaxID=1028688 RepID=A0A0B6ZQY4_9EUPU